MYRIEKDRRRKLDREMHGAFIRATDGMERQPSYAWYDMRRGRQFWWGPLSTRLEELREKGAPKDRVKQIAQALDQFIDDLYSDPPTQAA